jgi:diguanylate cyclase (GGDEF)-like protein
LAVLLHASEEDCYNIAERIRTTIKKHEFSIPGSKFKVTLSAGVAVARRDEALSDLLRRADQCMYMAKRSGRDRTVTESELDTPAHTG